MRSSKDTRMDQPKASSSKLAAARALQILVGNAKAKQKKHKRRIAGKKIVYRDKTHCGMDTVEGTLTVGTAVKWFSVLA